LNSSTAAVIPDSKHRESTVDFVRWALAQLELECREDQGIGQLTLPEADQPSFPGHTELRLALRPPSGNNESLEAIDLESRFGQWLLARLHALGPAVSVRPAVQPSAVNDIAAQLFSAYQVDGGRVHLGGCQLADFPFLRLSFVAPSDGPTQVRHLFVAHDGSSVSEELAHALGLLQIEPVIERPPRIEESALQSLLTAGRRVAAQSVAPRDPQATSIEPAATALVWVKHASGTLNFTIGETTVSQPFSGWAKLLEAQPYTSPQSGASSFHLAATDDGRIDAQEQIVACQQSGQRVLRQELVTCSASGKHVLEKFTERCPVSGKPCLTEEFSVCPTCQQRVGNQALTGTSCSACCGIKKIKRDDPRLIWILGEHTGLDRWKQWKLAETKQVYIAEASSWSKRLRVVVDKETLAVHHLATAGKWGGTWTPVELAARAEFLQ
jgi:hypothetical protein